MLISAFTIQVVQNIIAIFTDKFNDWSDQEYNQGFSWRSNSVSFITLEDGSVLTEVHLSEKMEVKKNATRAIVVPFKINRGDEIEISGIYEKENRILQILEGSYALLFQMGYTGKIITDDQFPDIQEKETWCNISFVRNENAVAEILIKDEGLHPSDVLVLEGKPVS